MTNQEAFDKVLNHLRIQKVPAKIGDSCCYRGAGNTMCAVGCLIPDSEYQEGFERQPIFELMKTDKLPFLKGLNVDLLEAMQTAHDNYLENSLISWEERMAYTASKFGLEYQATSTSTSTSTF